MRCLDIQVCPRDTIVDHGGEMLRVRHACTVEDTGEGVVFEVATNITAADGDPGGHFEHTALHFDAEQARWLASAILCQLGRLDALMKGEDDGKDAKDAD